MRTVDLIASLIEAGELNFGTLAIDDNGLTDAPSIDLGQLAEKNLTESSAGSVLEQIGGFLSESGNSGSATRLGQEAGFTIDFIEEPASLLGLIFGQDVDLFSYIMPVVGFDFNFSRSIPIWTPPPINLSIGGGFGAPGTACLWL